MFDKTRQQFPDLSLQACLSYSCTAKNSMYKVHGFAPAQLAIGMTPKFPKAIDDRLPATEKFSVSKTVADHLSAMVKCRE